MTLYVGLIKKYNQLPQAPEWKRMEQNFIMSALMTLVLPCDLV